MKKLKLSLLIFVLFFAGCAVGYHFKPDEEEVDCKLEESRVIQGCEIAAFQMRKQLRGCEWELETNEQKVRDYCGKLLLPR